MKQRLMRVTGYGTSGYSPPGETYRDRRWIPGNTFLLWIKKSNTPGYSTVMIDGELLDVPNAVITAEEIEE